MSINKKKVAPSSSSNSSKIKPPSSSLNKRLIPNKEFSSSSKDEFFFSNSIDKKNLNKILQTTQQSGILNLSNQQLSNIPIEVFQLNELNFGEEGKWWEREALKSIDLSNNNLLEIPDDIKKLKENLKTLLVNNNEIRKIFDGIFELEHLIKLNLNYNQLNNLSLNNLLFIKFTNLSEIFLSHNNFSSFPQSICECPHLQIVDLSHNFLTTIPDSVGNLSSLKFLLLGSNFIKSFSSKVLELNKLEFLELQNNKLTSIPSIHKLSSIVRIDLRENNLLEIPNIGDTKIPITEIFLGFNKISQFPQNKEFFNLPKLMSLDLQNNNLSEVPIDIINLKSLITLDLRNNMLKNLPGDICFMNLQKFLIEGNLFKSIPRHIIEKGTKSILQFLRTRISEDKLVQYESEINKQNIPNSQDNINDAQYDGKYVANNQKLTEISPKIFELNNLTKVIVQKNLISEIPNTIGMLVNLQVLDVQCNKISKIPPEISGCSLLTEIDISSNQISMIETLCNSINLKIINCGNNRITAIPLLLFHLPKLWSFSAPVNQINQVPSSISNATSLELLNLSNNKISLIPATELIYCKSLGAIDLSNNDISVIPPELGLITSLKKLQLSGNSIKNVRLAMLEKPTSVLLEYLRNKIVS